MKRFTFLLALVAVAVLVSVPAFAATATQPVQKQQSNPSTTTNVKPATQTSRTEHAMKQPHMARVDLNTATREELLKVPGLTEAIADKIIADRPYKRVSDLESKKVLTRDEFRSFKSHFTLKSNEGKWQKSGSSYGSSYGEKGSQGMKEAPQGAK